MNNKIDWVRKLTSRKFWALVADFVAAMILLFTSNGDPTQVVCGAIMAFGGVVAYILGEAITDKAGIEAQKEENEEVSEDKE